MQAVFKYGLDKIELENIEKFCNSVDYCSIEQSVGWSQLFYKSKICYFYLFDESGIKSFSQINEGVKSAQIYFGPVCCEKEVMITSINEIIHYYKKRGFYYLGIQMYYKSGYDTDYIEYALNKLYNIKYIFNNQNTKSSIEINLENSIEEIWRNFREGHKKSVKKAQKMGLTINEVKDLSELETFMEINSKMCKARHISDNSFVSRNIIKIFNYLIENNRGRILLAKDRDGIVVGGDMLVYQGNSVIMYKGATDPDRRDLPISHLLIYEAIIKAKNDQFKYFDFWGYNHFADKNDQVYYINQFKKGFGGYYTFFGKKMNISLVPYGYNIFKIFITFQTFLQQILK